jgi:hypothetical protein
MHWSRTGMVLYLPKEHKNSSWTHGDVRPLPRGREQCHETRNHTGGMRCRAANVLQGRAAQHEHRLPVEGLEVHVLAASALESKAPEGRAAVRRIWKMGIKAAKIGQISHGLPACCIRERRHQYEFHNPFLGKTEVIQHASRSRDQDKSSMYLGLGARRAELGDAAYAEEIGKVHHDFEANEQSKSHCELCDAMRETSKLELASPVWIRKGSKKCEKR